MLRACRRAPPKPVTMLKDATPGARARLRLTVFGLSGAPLREPPNLDDVQSFGPLHTDAARSRSKTLNPEPASAVVVESRQRDENDEDEDEDDFFEVETSAYDHSDDRLFAVVRYESCDDEDELEAGSVSEAEARRRDEKNEQEGLRIPVPSRNGFVGSGPARGERDAEAGKFEEVLVWLPAEWRADWTRGRARLWLELRLGATLLGWTLLSSHQFAKLPRRAARAQVSHLELSARHAPLGCEDAARSFFCPRLLQPCSKTQRDPYAPRVQPQYIID